MKCFLGFNRKTANFVIIWEDEDSLHDRIIDENLNVPLKEIKQAFDGTTDLIIRKQFPLYIKAISDGNKDAQSEILLHVKSFLEEQFCKLKKEDAAELLNMLTIE